MRISSHFIGVKIRSEYLADVYARLQKAVGKDSGIIEFQNILSAHVTLFYFRGGIRSDTDLRKAREVAREFDVHRLERGFEGFGSFGTPDSPRLYYFVPKSGEILESWNRRLVGEFGDYLDEEALAFTPHVTFFRIRKVAKFLEKETLLERLLAEELESLKNAPVFERVSVFQVHSGFRPQIHIELFP